MHVSDKDTKGFNTHIPFVDIELLIPIISPITITASNRSSRSTTTPSLSNVLIILVLSIAVYTVSSTESSSTRNCSGKGEIAFQSSAGLRLETTTSSTESGRGHHQLEQSKVATTERQQRQEGRRRETMSEECCGCVSRDDGVAVANPLFGSGNSKKSSWMWNFAATLSGSRSSCSNGDVAFELGYPR